MARIKLFSLAQAEKALPLVRRVVADLVKAFHAREERLLERRKLPPQPAPGSQAEERALRFEKEMEACEADLRRYVEELEQIGVELKDYQHGLIDFFSLYEGRVVHLCWKLDEGERLEWWHELQEGFRGRQPITPGNRERFKGGERR